MGKSGRFSPGRLPIGALVLIVLFLVASTPEAPSASPPFPFPHDVMVQAGVSCLFCHSDALRSPAAGMPSMKKCMDCHATIATGSEEIQTLAGYWQRQEPILWERHLQLPRFVYFSHRVHVGVAGLNCERCHGDVSQMTEALPVVDANMGWCINCHDQQENAEQLRDCIVCHQ